MSGNMIPPTTFLSMGQETYKVSLNDLFGVNRQKLASRLQPLVPAKSVVYLVGGISETRNDSDHEPIFRQESYFLYLTGVREPDCALCLEVDTGRTTLFIPELPASYATVMGHIKSPQECKDIYQLDHGEYTKDAETYLERLLGLSEHHDGLSGSQGSTPKLLLMEGTNSDSKNLYHSPTIQSDKLQSVLDKLILFEVLAECRVHKSPAERHLLQHVTELTSFAHAYTMRNTKPGMMEYQSESLFRHYCYYNYGCRFVGYTPICGCGPNGAILHYGHAGEPNERQLQDGDMCLYDMGAEYLGGYGSDVTCSFPANGKFTDKQTAVFHGVLNAQRAVYNMLKPGVAYTDCHKAAEKEILTMLIQIGLVVPQGKTLDELVVMRLGAVFMPHGLGHFIGIDTHDVGGYLSGHPERSSLPGLKSLRTARVMETDMVLTVEPGCYFIDHLLDEALQEDSPFRPHLNAELVTEYRGMGGVRLEDVVAITEDGMVNYTLCPRTIEEIEHTMAGGKWPPMRDEAPELRRIRLTDPTPLPSPPSL